MNIHLRDSWDTPCRHLKGTVLIESAYQGSPVASLFFLMANGFYVVAVGILHEAAVVVVARKLIAFYVTERRKR
jgi:hypothetical protein